MPFSPPESITNLVERPRRRRTLVSQLLHLVIATVLYDILRSRNLFQQGSRTSLSEFAIEYSFCGILQKEYYSKMVNIVSIIRFIFQKGYDKKIMLKKKFYANDH